MAVQPKPKRVRGRVTGLRYDAELVKAAKHKAIDEGTTLTKIIEAALKQYLRQPRGGQPVVFRSSQPPTQTPRHG